ncbi:DUF3794 domain-containing protein [Clostridium tarantellae]|uniref:DUF3794 domain-containing protein n=1 Tax=Clostridium tarantellae TaxID=39493 RepID=A0A6I1MJ88_9CLOT|nr:DUF3794 domain-containing protein [Clostridium tarantellae]MPQ43596.1 DUF3794 domain-containing protein [Clostridium tarantellae]
MYCKCSNKNNYEVISLCNIKNFTNKNGPFINSAWTQISLADILTLPYNCPKIEKIEKIYIEVNITSNKIIKTPKSPAANAEGLILTGKKLLIDGYFCIKLVYTSLTKEQSIHSINFNIPFCTYIVIEENVDLFIDAYCVKTCVEDIFASLIKCNTIFFNVTFFLFASKITPTCPVPQPPKDDCTINFVQPKIPNTITFKTASLNNNISEITFDIQLKQIKATSTGISSGRLYSHISFSNNEFFSFKLRDFNQNIKTKASIKGEENADVFVKKLNNMSFEVDDIIELEVLIPKSVQITHFPTKDNVFLLGNSSGPGDSIKEYYQITPGGLRTYTPNPPIQVQTLLSSIIVKNLNDLPIITIMFNNEDKKLITSSEKISVVPAGSDPQPYFTFKLSRPDGTIIRDSITMGTTTPANFYSQLIENFSFDYEDIIELTYTDSSISHITINLKGVNHTPTKLAEKYKITPNGLVEI